MPAAMREAGTHLGDCLPANTRQANTAPGAHAVNMMPVGQTSSPATAAAKAARLGERSSLRTLRAALTLLLLKLLLRPLRMGLEQFRNVS
jgi:hypothetical protein